MTGAQGPRQRAAETKRLRTRATLLTAAAKVFAEKGWQARMEDIAERASVSAATAYNHFPSKLDLMMHTFIGIMEPFQEKVKQDIATEVDPTFAVQRYIADLSHHLRRSHKNLVAAFLAATAEAASNTLGPLILDATDGGGIALVNAALPEMPLADLIAYGQTAGVFRPEVSALALGSYHTYAMFWMIVGKVWFPAASEGGSSVSEFVLNQLLAVIKREV